MTGDTPVAPTTRWTRPGWFTERANAGDFPFCDGDVQVAAWKWALIVLACLAGFAALSSIPVPDQIGALLPRILLPAIPLAVFIACTGRHAAALFRRVTGRDVVTMICFCFLNLVVSVGMAVVVRALFGVAVNRATSGLAAAGPAEIAAFYVGTGLQIFGEELFTILPFLAVLTLLRRRVRLSRTAAVAVAWLVTAVWFGAAHLPTYEWHVAQALLIIGVARLVLTLAYIRTKNILVPTGAHILSDWTIFTLLLITGTAVA